MDLKTALQQKRLYFDGAMGTMIQSKIENVPTPPERLNFINPALIGGIEKSYIDVGTRVLHSYTFGVNRYKFKGTGLEIDETVQRAVTIARAQNPDYVILEIGPIGALVGDLGDIDMAEAIDIFGEVVRSGVQAGVDGVYFGTMTDITEAKAGVIAAKENCDLPILVSMTFEGSGRTLTGSDPLTIVTILEAMGVDAIGMNCSVGPAQMLPIVAEMAAATHLPIMIQPNAGLPKMVDGRTHFDVGPEEFAEIMAQIASMGRIHLGGCCGTTPAHIAAMIERTKDIPFVPWMVPTQTRLATPTKTLAFDGGVYVVGESINPSSSKALKADLRRGSLSVVKKLTLRQVADGASLLDINMGLPEIDEKNMMIEGVAAVSKLTDLPLVIDSVSPEVLEGVLRTYPGKALINSVNGDDASLERVLPIAKKYGAAVLGLTMDERGLPKSAEQRVQIAKKIMNRAKEIGIAAEDVFFDCLTLSISTDQKRTQHTLSAMRELREAYGCQLLLGVSNISFGLPNRSLINRSFLWMALEAGLTCPIMNLGDRGMMDTIAAWRALTGRDPGCRDYIRDQKDRQPEREGTAGKTVGTPGDVAIDPSDIGDLTALVVAGMKEEAAACTKAMLSELSPLTIINEHLIPGLDIVGQDFETGKAFLPNLIFAAEAVKAAFDVIKAAMPGDRQIVKGRIVLATVHGDVHDIGKNILKVILENYGYEILDLGKDVPAETIIDTVRREDIVLVGLSALMTTTVKEMEATIRALHEACPTVKIMVGGAVLNPQYAQMIGADFYGKDARAGVTIAREVFGQ